MKKNALSFLPLVLLILLVLMLFHTLKHNPFQRDSALLHQPAPLFNIPTLDGASALSNASFQNKITLIHFWASWCGYCQREYAGLHTLSQESEITWIGINFRDERKNALHLIEQHSSPYAAIGFDPKGKVATDFGVTGAPETFLIDAKGIIRLRHQGPLTPEAWKSDIMPILREIGLF